MKIKHNMTTTYYNIQTEYYNFNAKIQSLENNIDDKLQYNVSFGGKYKCVDITIYENEPISWLTGAKHHPKCADKNLKKGDDGTILMIKTALLFAHQVFPFIKEFRFLDDSKIECKKDLYIKLSTYYISKYGSTWYSLKFNAVPTKNKRDTYERLRGLKKYLDSPKQKQKYSYDDFYKNYVLLNKQYICDDILELIQSLRDIYVSSSTFREFILETDKKFENKGIFQVWLDYFINSNLEGSITQSDWTIKVKDINNLNLQFNVISDNPFKTKNKNQQKINFNNVNNIMQRGGLILSPDMFY